MHTLTSTRSVKSSFDPLFSGTSDPSLGETPVDGSLSKNDADNEIAPHNHGGAGTNGTDPPDKGPAEIPK
jgi:hypothetical protein